MAALHHIYIDTHTYIYIILYYYSFPSSYFFHSFGQAGWLRPFSSVTGISKNTPASRTPRGGNISQCKVGEKMLERVTRKKNKCERKRKKEGKIL
jgi:hypothetical protein